MDQRPIGIFDSGLGGLTAAMTLETILPEEDLVYFGDSANMPYGVKSKPEIRSLALANAAFLNRFDVKAVLVACGTVSSNALGDLREKYSMPFFGVVEAACAAAVHSAPTGRIAVIATKATIESAAFEKCIQGMLPNATVFSKACQSLVVTVENGHFRFGDPVAEQAVAEELAAVKAFAPEVLILACTHFPLLQESIERYMGAGTKLFSVSEETAKQLKEYLTEHDMLSGRRGGTREWYTSGDTDAFEENAALFLGHAVNARKHVND